MITCVRRPGSKRVRSRYRFEDPYCRQRSLERVRRATLLAIGSIFIYSCNVQGVMPGSSGRTAVAPGGSPSPTLVRHANPVYPYSLIPGGVSSVDELRKALAKDLALAAHFAGFDLNKARLVASDRARLMYSSYRKDGAIYWTKQPIHIAQGEMLITEGSSWVRARCGNRLSDVPQYPQGIDTIPERPIDTPAGVSAPPVGDASGDFSDLPHPHLAFQVFPALVDGDNGSMDEPSAAPDEARITAATASRAATLPLAGTDDAVELASYFNLSLPIDPFSRGPLDPSVSQSFSIQNPVFTAAQTTLSTPVQFALPNFLPNPSASVAYLLPPVESYAIATTVAGDRKGSPTVIPAPLLTLTSPGAPTSVVTTNGVPPTPGEDFPKDPTPAAHSFSPVPEASPALLALCGLLLMTPSLFRARKSKTKGAGTSRQGNRAMPQPRGPESPSWDETVPWRDAARTPREPRS